MGRKFDPRSMMSRKNRKRVSILCVAAGSLFGGIASAQTAPGTAPGQAAAQRPPSGRAPADPRQAGAPNNSQPQTPTRADTAALMQKSGGSLLQASLASAPDPAQARLRDVSFFGVPEPEPRTIKKHDLVTIVVREESAFSSKGTADLKRETDIEAKLEEFIKLKLSNFEIQGGAAGVNPPSVKFNGTREFKGDGEVDRTDSLTARITGEVLDVKPNGTIVLQARKQIRTDEEVQQFILTGICRAEDVNADNTILSTQLFDLQLQKNHKGAVRDATKRGWFLKFLDAVSPF
jgi:flagellar L-ring protein precursor FlgH